MKLSIISFTEKGIQLSETIGKALETGCELFTKCSACCKEERTVQFVTGGVSEWAAKQLEEGNALLFIGACGIAVRAAAPHITDKLHDSPVLVMDEQGQYVIPILSGHVGGANALAVRIAEKTGAEPVITTATDRNGKFAVDLFAKENGLSIVNKSGIAKVSAKVLSGKNITMSVQPGYLEEGCRLPEGIRRIGYPPAQKVDIVITSENREFDTELLLKPREYVIGMGCRKGKEAEKIGEFIAYHLKKAGISPIQVAGLASIDVKKEEPGLLAWSRKERIPFVTYTAGELRCVEGDFQRSEFVREQVGVDNVCERAALKMCGSEGTLVYAKHAEDGMTIAIAKKAGTNRKRQSMKPKRKEGNWMKNKIYIVGMGPGREDMMTGEAVYALEQADVIIGYAVYLKLLGERFREKEMRSTPMRQEIERCRLAFEEAERGKRVAFLCSGDAGIYGMASLLYEIGIEYPETELVVIPGVTAASSGAAVLGAPLNHDFCVISLSDLLTPWEKIEKRLVAAAEGDFAMAIYNPASHKRKDHLQRACDVLLRYIEGERACGYVKNIGREGTRAVTCTLQELREAPVNMFTTVFIGNAGSEMINGKLITRRGYQIERNTDICGNNGR